jgi:LytR cell envelope-related transcriptional attenuator
VGPPPAPRLGFTRETPLETPGTQPSRAPELDPPRSDEGLDDWFARRLEAKGIRSGKPQLPLARVLAVAALAVAVGLLLWVLTGIGGSSTAANTHTGGGPTASPPPPTSSGSTGTTKTTPKIPWKTIPLEIFNGFSQTVPAAATAQSQLQAQGWTVTTINNTSPQSTTTTFVVYPPGKLAAAKVVAHRLHIKQVLPLAQATAQGVPSTLASVAIVLGPSGIPSAGG